MGTWARRGIQTGEDRDIIPRSTWIFRPQGRNNHTDRCIHKRRRFCRPARWTTYMLLIQGANRDRTELGNRECEALGVVWGLEKFRYFLYGKQCTVHTEHKPLESIFKKKLTTCPARLQRFVLRALKYDVTVKYVKGSQVPIADALSRLSPQPAPPKGQLPQLSIHQVTDTLPASPAKLQQIRDLTTSDPTLSQLRDTTTKNGQSQETNVPAGFTTTGISEKNWHLKMVSSSREKELSYHLPWDPRFWIPYIRVIWVRKSASCEPVPLCSGRGSTSYKPCEDLRGMSETSTTQ